MKTHITHHVTTGRAVILTITHTPSSARCLTQSCEGQVRHLLLLSLRLGEKERERERERERGREGERERERERERENESFAIKAAGGGSSC